MLFDRLLNLIDDRYGRPPAEIDCPDLDAQIESIIAQGKERTESFTSPQQDLDAQIEKIIRRDAVIEDPAPIVAEINHEPMAFRRFAREGRRGVIPFPKGGWCLVGRNTDSDHEEWDPLGRR